MDTPSKNHPNEVSCCYKSCDSWGELPVTAGSSPVKWAETHLIGDEPGVTSDGSPPAQACPASAQAGDAPEEQPARLGGSGEAPTEGPYRGGTPGGSPGVAHFGEFAFGSIAGQ